MPSTEITTLGDGRLSFRRTVLRECESYTAPLSDFLARLDSQLPSEDDRKNAYITVTDAGFVVSVVHVETDQEMAERRERLRSEARALLDVSRSRAATPIPA